MPLQPAIMPSSRTDERSETTAKGADQGLRQVAAGDQQARPGPRATRVRAAPRWANKDGAVAVLGQAREASSSQGRWKRAEAGVRGRSQGA